MPIELLSTNYGTAVNVCAFKAVIRHSLNRSRFHRYLLFTGSAYAYRASLYIEQITNYGTALNVSLSQSISMPTL